MNSKTVKESAIENQVYEIFPNDLNPRGTIFGGRVLELIDILGGIVARRHSEKVCVTASMDSIDFVAPAKTGDILILKAAVNNAWNTSCEVGVKVFVEDPKTRARKHLASAYLTFVALDDEGKPTSMPKIIPKTRIEKIRFHEAEARRRIRLQRKAGKARLRPAGLRRGKARLRPAGLRRGKARLRPAGLRRGKARLRPAGLRRGKGGTGG